MMNCSIGQVAKTFKVSISSLRSWEKQGFIPKPNRRPTGIREYSDDDIKAIEEFLKRRQ